MKVGEAITRLLAEYGVETVFGIPGTHTLELYRGLAKDCGIEHVLAHHEQGAGFMADGYARVSGKPGVCFVITGAGVTNIATPMAEAYADSAPMLVISPVNPPDGGGYNQGRLHEITDQPAVTAPFTAFSALAQSVEEIPLLIARAFSLFNSDRPCPVHISIPLPLLSQEVEQPWQAQPMPEKPRVGNEQLEQAKLWIEQAENPVIIVGGGARFCSEQVVELAQTIGCPVVTTIAGRGVIPGSHPLCPGAQLRVPLIQDLLRNSDLAILLATELASTDHYNVTLPVPQKQIRVNLNLPSLQGGSQVLPIRAEVGDTISRLTALIDPQPESRYQTSQVKCDKVKASLNKTTTAKEKCHLQILECIQEYLAEDTLVFSDMTQLAYTAIDYLPLEHSNSWHHPTGYGTLGYAVPAAMGASMVDRGKPVIAIVGDGGLQYTMQELPLAVELELNLTVLLWNNDSLEQIKDDMLEAGIAPIGVKQKNPDFRLLAQACDWHYDQVDCLDELYAKVNTAITTNSPYLLQINEYSIFPEPDSV